MVVKTIKRLVTCQGSVQLINALSVLLQHERLGAASRLKSPHNAIQYQNYLVIYELYAPNDQDREFVAFLRRMAETVCDWVAIVYITSEMRHAISDQLASTPPRQIAQSVYSWIGIDAVDEIYLCRNWQFMNRLFLNVYQSAQKICYGDGIGIYFSEQSAVVRYPTPEATRSAIQRIQSKLRDRWHRLRERLKLKTVLYPIEFDLGYFVLPNAFDEVPPMPIKIIDRRELLTVFQKFVNWVDLTVYQTALLNAQQKIAILLTSNLSEAERISQPNEIAAYDQFLRSHHVDLDTILVIKPHPRDDINKIRQLANKLSNLCQRVIVLDTLELFFLPFEIFFLQVFAPHQWKHIQIFAVSSACLSLKLLFDVESAIGFGETLTSNLFNPNQVAPRLEHEAILIKALQNIESARSCNA